MNVSVIKKYLRRFIVSVIMIYSLNYILLDFNFIVPLNIFSIIVSTILGFPGLLLFLLLLFKYR